MVQTIFVFNTGSSSVKASLLAPCDDDRDIIAHNNSDQSRPPPLRILTAHAESIDSALSSVRITFSSTLIDALINNEKGKGSPTCQTTREKKQRNKILKRQDSLQLTSRSSSSLLFSSSVKVHNCQLQHHQEKVEKTHEVVVEIKEPNMTHEIVLRKIVNEIMKYNESIFQTVIAVGHRVVHGGSFSEATIVNNDLISKIKNVSHLAPLHNPANLLGIQIGMELFHGIPQIAVFDTAFHSTISEFAYTYAIPKEYRDNQIRKYGFHGTSVKYISSIAMNKLQSLPNFQRGEQNLKLVVAHIGNGASVTAVVDGKSVDTTMEFTPLSGVIMGTRSGSIDPSVVAFASANMHKSLDEVINDLNKRSGLKAVSNGDSDMRCIEKRVAKGGDEPAKLALKMFVYSMAKHISSMIVACGGGIDALVFTAGIGENSSLVRKMIVDSLGQLLGNVDLDEDMNNQHGKNSNGFITKNSNSGAVVMVMHTDEEIGIYQECQTLITA